MECPPRPSDTSQGYNVPLTLAQTQNSVKGVTCVEPVMQQRPIGYMVGQMRRGEESRGVVGQDGHLQPSSGLLQNLHIHQLLRIRKGKMSTLPEQRAQRYWIPVSRAPGGYQQRHFPLDPTSPPTPHTRTLLQFPWSVPLLIPGGKGRLALAIREETGKAVPYHFSLMPASIC